MKDEEDLYGGSTECETDDEDEKDQGTLDVFISFEILY